MTSCSCQGSCKPEVGQTQCSGAARKGGRILLGNTNPNYIANYVRPGTKCAIVVALALAASAAGCSGNGKDSDRRDDHANYAVRTPVTDWLVSTNLQRALNPNIVNLANELQSHCPVKSMDRKADQGNYLRPCLAVGPKDKTIVVGRANRDDDMFYQILDTKGNPRLMPEDIFRQRFEAIFESPRKLFRAPNCDEISVSTLWHSIGAVKPNSKHDFEFIICNTSSTPVLLGAAQPSCGCIVPNQPTEALLQPGESWPIEGTISVRREMVIHRQLAIPVSVNGDRNSVIRLNIVGNQFPSASFTPKSLNFGSVSGNDVVTRTVVIEETRYDQFEIDKIDFPAGVALASSTESRSDNNTRKYTLTFLFTGSESIPASRSAMPEKIVIFTTSSISSPITIPVSATVVPYVTISPTVMVFDDCDCGQEYTLPLTIHCSNGHAGTLRAGTVFQSSLADIRVEADEHGYSIVIHAKRDGVVDSIIQVPAIIDSAESYLPIRCTARILK